MADAYAVYREASTHVGNSENMALGTLMDDSCESGRCVFGSSLRERERERESKDKKKNWKGCFFIFFKGSWSSECLRGRAAAAAWGEEVEGGEERRNINKGCSGVRFGLSPYTDHLKPLATKAEAKAKHRNFLPAQLRPRRFYAGSASFLLLLLSSLSSVTIFFVLVLPHCKLEREIWFP